ncbi:MAG: hypothetical protein U1A77_14990 [Pirellulales bacterium]
MVRVFLGMVGFAYLALALWCSFSPESTARAVGFTLIPGAGQSEFLTVYGGLEFALGVLFLWPVVQRSDPKYSLVVCLVIHASLVAFRSLGFLLFDGLGGTTYSLAATEWVILLGSAILTLKLRRGESPARPREN